MPALRFHLVEMRQFIGAAVFGGDALFRAVRGPGGNGASVVAAFVARRPCANRRFAAAARAHGELAPGQSRADYYAWLARAPEHRAQVQAFRDHLAAQGLEDVVPVWQLIRTSSSWRQCAADRFEVAPATNGNISSPPCASCATRSCPRSARSRRCRAIATSSSTAARTAPRKAPTACSSRSI